MKCEICSAEFRRTYAGQRTCGRVCGWTLRKQSQGPISHPATAVAYRPCAQCDDLFVARATNKSKKYCGDQCLAEASYERQYGRKRPTRHCRTCEVELAEDRGRAGRPSAYCGDRCRTAGVKRTRARARAVERLAGHRKSETHRSRARRYGVPYEPVNVRGVFASDQWICKLCDKPVDRCLTYPDPMSASLDHVQPLSCGGGHTRSNVQLAHLACNIAKGAQWDGDTFDGTTQAGPAAA